MTVTSPGKHNLLTDVAGLYVGNAQDHEIKTGVTVITGDHSIKAAVHVMGGAPGTRETDLLAPENIVQEVDAIVLSGGSALGLSAASGIADSLRRKGRGYRVVDQSIPIVPAAILFDLLNGGKKDWDENPYPELGERALANASNEFKLGSVGAGTGATTAGLKGGLGSASILLPTGETVAALVAANPRGSAIVGNGPHFWAAPHELNAEFGALGPATKFEPAALPKTKADHKQNTTIAVIATDATLSQSQLKRVAIAAHDGMARALLPSHTPYDGDLVFALSTGKHRTSEPSEDTTLIGHFAAICLARAIARAVFEATEAANDVFPTWHLKFS